MSSEAPPTFNVSIFIPSYWADQTTSGFDKTYADNHYLKFPVGQGTEYIPDLVVSGGTTLATTSASSLNVSGKTTTANIDLVNSSSTLDMKSGSITNLTSINGSAYPQSAGIDAVLATGNTATNKTLNLNYTTSVATDALNLTSTLSSTSTQISYNNFLTGNGTKILSIDEANGIELIKVGASNLGYSLYSATEFRMARSFAERDNIYNAITENTSIIYNNTDYASTSSNTSTPISTAIADGTYTGTLTSNALSLFTNSVSTARNAITNAGMTITGATSSITNTINSTSNTIANTTYTGTLTSNALSLFTNSVSTARNAITNAGMTITGATSSITNTISALSNIIANATYTTLIEPDNIKLYPTSTPTANYSTLTSQIFSVVADSTLYGTINARDNNFYDTTNLRYATLSSGGYATSGNSINNAKQCLYLGKTAPDQSATATNACLITESVLNMYGANNNRTQNSSNLTGSGLTVVGSNGSSRQTEIFNPPNNAPTNISSSAYAININSDTNAFYADNLNTAFIRLNSTSASSGTTGAPNMVFRRNKTISVGDCAGIISYGAVGVGISNAELARVSSYCKTNTSASLINGSLMLSARVNTAITDFLEINGAENQINALKPLDMNNNSIVSSTGGITLDATGSSGTGVITLNTKAGTAGTGTGLVLTGNTLTMTATGTNTQEPAHLCLYLPDPATGLSKLYKIQLLQ